FTGLPGFTLQPAELMKLALIIFLASTINKHKQKFETPTTKSDFILIGKIILYTVIPIIFIFQQPDLATSIVVIFVAGALILLADIDWKVLAVVAIGSVAALGISLLLVVNLAERAEKTVGIKHHQIERILTRFSADVQDSNDT